MTGATFSELEPDGLTVLAFAVAFAGSVAFWWVYFHRKAVEAGLLPLAEGETISTVLPLPEDEAEWGGLHIMFATARGTVRRNSMDAFTNIPTAGKIAMKFEGEDADDSLIGVLGAVVLAVTGGEALYADMGHFGKRPIQAAWLGLCLPALVLNYFGQGALVLSDPAARANPFFQMIPQIARPARAIVDACASLHPKLDTIGPQTVSPPVLRAGDRTPRPGASTWPIAAASPVSSSTARQRIILI